jgi:hypothetical protein
MNLPAESNAGFQVVNQNADAFRLQFALEPIERHQQLASGFFTQLPQLFFKQSLNRRNVLSSLWQWEL